MISPRTRSRRSLSSRGSVFERCRSLPWLLAASSLSFGGCQRDGDPAERGARGTQAASLDRAFPKLAEIILLGSEPFARGPEETFVLSTKTFDRGRRLRAELPKQAERGIRFVLPVRAGAKESTFTIRVRELGVAGEGELAGAAVVYGRSRGRSYWHAAARGYEEWIHLPAASANEEAEPVAWDIEGGAVQQAGDAVEILDENRIVRLRVSAPKAYAAGGRELAARLVARGSRLELVVETHGEEALIDPLWVPSNDMPEARWGHVAIGLPNGQILVAGGSAVDPLASSALYTPSTDGWVVGPPMAVPRQAPRAVLLANGKALVLGGMGTPSSQIYDPLTGTWSASVSLTGARQTMALAYVAGIDRAVAVGGYVSGAALDVTDTYSTATNTWTAAAPSGVARQDPAAIALPNGLVLVTGGRGAAQIGLASCQLYNPATDTWSATGSLSQGRHEHSLVLLPNGTVLAVGGVNYTTPTSGQGLRTAEVYDPATGLWSSAGIMNDFRYSELSPVVLPNGRALVAGETITTSSAELYDPIAKSWASAGALFAPRFGNSTTLLLGGKVLVAGGTIADVTSKTVEIYSPYETAVACTFDGECGSGSCADGVCCDAPCKGACQACTQAKKGSGADGTCGPIAGGTDPDDECAATAASGCGTTGSCDGAGACAKFGASTVCLAAACSGSTASPASLCDGGGTCIPSVPVACAPFPCLEGTCSSTCAVDGDCSAGAYCSAGLLCVTQKANGAGCGADGQCVSGHCVDGVCCNTACDGGACDACSKDTGASTDGACEPLTGKACDDGNLCTQTDSCQAGVCTGTAPVQCGTTEACKASGACDPANGQCTQESRPDGTLCPGGQCVMGVCDAAGAGGAGVAGAAGAEAAGNGGNGGNGAAGGALGGASGSGGSAAVGGGTGIAGEGGVAGRAGSGGSLSGSGGGSGNAGVSGNGGGSGIGGSSSTGGSAGTPGKGGVAGEAGAGPAGIGGGAGTAGGAGIVAAGRSGAAGGPGTGGSGELALTPLDRSEVGGGLACATSAPGNRRPDGALLLAGLFALSVVRRRAARLGARAHASAAGGAPAAARPCPRHGLGTSFPRRPPST